MDEFAVFLIKAFCICWAIGKFVMIYSWVSQGRRRR